MTARVLFVFRGDKHKLLVGAPKASAPREFLYGLPFFDDERLDVTYVEDARPFAHLSERVWVPLQRWFGRRYSIGLNLHAAIRERRSIRAADVIITTVDSYGLPILLAKSLGMVDGRVIYISQGLYRLAARAQTSALDERVRRLVGSWLSRADLVVALGEGDEAAIERSFGDVAQLRLRTILFGIDEEFWTPDPSARQDGPILSVGSDFLRDYPTLLRAAGTRPLRIVTRLPVPADLRGPNVIVDGEVDWVGLRELYQHAPFVVSPIKNEPRNSGHSATLQAMACAKAVILSDTPGLWDRAGMRHGETCWLIEPEDVGALERAIVHLETHPDLVRSIGLNARVLVEERYGAQLFGRRLQDAALALV